MLQPLHRNNINTPTRCDVMVAEPSRDWSVFKQIFAEHWDAFQHAHPRYQTSYYDSRMAKMLGCGNPEKMGYLEYCCLQCGQGKPLDPRSRAKARTYSRARRHGRRDGKALAHQRLAGGYPRLRWACGDASPKMSGVR